jgi:hypothetical protein
MSKMTLTTIRGQLLSEKNAIRKIFLIYIYIYIFFFNFFCFDYPVWPKFVSVLEPELLPMRDLGSLSFLNRHTFVCGTLFPRIKLNYELALFLKQSSTYKSSILIES